MVLVSPSAAFVAKLPHQKIPDRKDFLLFEGRDQARKEYWREVQKRSQDMGEELMKIIDAGEMAAHIKPL